MQWAGLRIAASLLRDLAHLLRNLLIFPRTARWHWNSLHYSSRCRDEPGTNVGVKHEHGREQNLAADDLRGRAGRDSAGTGSVVKLLRAPRPSLGQTLGFDHPTTVSAAHAYYRVQQKMKQERGRRSW